MRVVVFFEVPDHNTWKEIHAEVQFVRDAVGKAVPHWQVTGYQAEPRPLVRPNP